MGVISAPRIDDVDRTIVSEQSIGPLRRRRRHEISEAVDATLARYYLSHTGNTRSNMTTTVTVKGQVTLPKAVRQAAGIRPGDRVNVRVRPEGGVIVEAAADRDGPSAYLQSLEGISRRRPIRSMTTEEVMALTRGND
jgi:AbrB family looped-hinge helix DNA binding protein